MKARITAIMNLKGGVGKTTTSVELAVELGNKGLKVLVVDVDPQANTSASFLDTNRLIDEDLPFVLDEPVNDEASLAALLISEDPKPRKYIQKTKFDNVDILATNLSLINTERELMLSSTVNQLDVLNNALYDIYEDYDHIVIDTNPYWNLISNNVVMIVDEIIIPIKLDRYAVSGFRNTVNNIIALKKRNKRLRFKISVMYTMTQRNNYDTKGRKQLTEYIESLGINVYKTSIRHQAKPVSESAQYDKPLVNQFQKTNNVAKEYRAFVNEFTGGNK